MKPDTGRKRLYSALAEPPIADGRKRTKHDLKGAQPAMIHQTEASSFETHDLESHPRNQPRCSDQAETPESPSSFTPPEPYGAQCSQAYFGNSVKQSFAPDDSSSPTTIGTLGNHLSSNNRHGSKQTPTLYIARKDAIIQSSQDSFDEKSIFTATSEHSSLISSMFLLYFQYIQPSIFFEKSWEIMAFPTLSNYQISLYLIL